MMELRGFRKIRLEPGEHQMVEFQLTREMLSYWDPENRFIFEPGEFRIMIGRNSADTQSATIVLS
jgi:beta-glucosidase